MPDRSSIAEAMDRARGVIEDACAQAGRDPGEVGVMAVTKTHPVALVRTAIDAGVRVFGENRVTEGGRKIRQLGSTEGCTFHMIGPLHRKEVRQAMRDFQWIDSLDRMKIAREIARRMEVKDVPQPGLLLEVNTSGEESKHGFPPEAGRLAEVLEEISRLGLEVEGLMTVGPLGQGEKASRSAFALLRTLRHRLRENTGLRLPQLSMGMTDDFHSAVLEGSTMVRLGRYLFGSRR